MRLVSRVRNRRDDDHGFVLVWFAIVLVVLLGVAAFAVDLVHAYAEAQGVQNAADAAALAGAIAIPSDTGVCDKSGPHALDTARQNGYTDGTNGVSIQATCGANNQMTVDVHKTFDTFFARVLGVDTLTVDRKAIAQFDPPVQMGSAANHVGDIPICPPGFPADNTSCVNDPGTPAQEIWATVDGPTSEKRNGNAISSANCTYGTGNTDGCSPGGTGGSNDEYSANGEYFQIRDDNGGPLDIWIYDPSFVNTKPSCGAAPFGNPAIDDPNVTDWNFVDPTIVANNKNTAYCPGDTYLSGPQNPINPTGKPPDTQFQLLGPDAVPDKDPSNNPAVSGCQSPDFPGFADPGTNPPPADPGKSGPNAALSYQLATGQPTYFHQWYHLCQAPGQLTEDGNEFELNVKSLVGAGANAFAILVTHGTSNQNANTRLGAFAREALPITAVNFASTAAKFYLARVLPSSHDRTLDINFFDLGDSSVSGGIATGSLEVDLLNASGNLSCTSTPAPPSGAGPRPSPVLTPWPIASDPTTDFTNNGCSGIRYDATKSPPSADTWDARWISLQVTIPAATSGNGYTCDPSSYENCWIQLKFAPDSGAALSDTTTWDAHMEGSPVRLVG